MCSSDLRVGGSTNATFGGSLNGGLSLVKTGAETLTLSGTSTCQGPTIIEQGSLVAANAGALGTPVNPVVVDDGATLAVNAGSGSKGLAWAYYTTAGSQSTFTGSLAVIQSSVANLTPARIATKTTFPSSGGFPFTPGTYCQTLCSGLLKITTPGTYTFTRKLQDDDAAIFVDGKTLVPGVPMTNATPWTQGAASGSIDLNAGYHSITVPWYQGYGGYLLQVQWSGPDTSYGTVDLSTGSATLTPDLYIANLSGAGSVSLDTGNLFAGFNNADSAFSGVISGVGGLNKWGAAY